MCLWRYAEHRSSGCHTIRKYYWKNIRGYGEGTDGGSFSGSGTRNGTGKIFAGIDATQGEFPWLVQLMM